MGREAQKQPQPQPSEQQVSYTVEQLLAFNPYNPPDIHPDLKIPVNEQVLDKQTQACAVHILSLTYQKVSRAMMLAEVALTIKPSLDKFIAHRVANFPVGYLMRDGLIVIPQNKFNHPELDKSGAEIVPFEHVTRMFPILS